MRTFSVKNFERFQHYKDRSPPWIKLYNSTLDDYAFGCLQDASKMHLIGIWLLASRNDNKIPCDSDWIRSRINATEPVDLQPLIDAGFIVINQELQSPEQDASKPLAKRLSRERGRDREREDSNTSPRKPPDDETPEFIEFWSLYPNKVGKGQARLAHKKALTKAPHADILAGLRRYIAGKPLEREWCHPTTFLNGERWNDQPAFAVVSAHPPPKPVERAPRQFSVGSPEWQNEQRKMGLA